VVPVTYGQAIVNAVPHATFCPIEEASHLVMMEQADMVATKVLDFMETHFFQ
jgi:hypothetical protein